MDDYNATGYSSLHGFLFLFLISISYIIFVTQEMAVRALKQTGSRNIEAALEYISKMGYLDPRNEQIVRVIKQTSPGQSNIFYVVYTCIYK